MVVEGFMLQGCGSILFLALGILKAAAVIPDEPVEAAFPSQPVQACQGFFRLCFTICRHLIFVHVCLIWSEATCQKIPNLQVLLSAQGIGSIIV